MKQSALFSVLALFLFFPACSSGDGDPEKSNHLENQQSQVQQQKSDIPYNFRMEMEGLITHYVELKSAVSNANMQEASKAAGELSAYTRTVLDEVLGAENHGLWLGIARIIRTETDKLTEADGPEDMRVYFEHISRAVIRIVDSFDPTGGPYYLMECEAASTGENQWISIDENIRNPYQTSAGESCGEIIQQFAN